MTVTEVESASADADPLVAEQRRLQRRLQALGDQAPDEARALVARIDALIRARQAQLAELKEASAAIDEAFAVRKHEEREREAREHAEQVRKLVSTVVAHEGRRLQAVEKAQTALDAFVAAVNEAKAANKAAHDAAQALGGTAGGFDDQRLVNRLSEYAAKMLLSNLLGTYPRGGSFGPHVSIRVPPALAGELRAARLGVSPTPSASWGEREAEAHAAAMAAIRSQVEGDKQ